MSVNEDHDRPGKWIVKRKYKDRAGNEKWTCKRGFDSYEDAKEWEKEFLKSIDYASEKYPKAIKDITLTRFFYDYYVKTLKSKESKQQAISKFERKIKPYLGDKFLLDITGRDVLTWQSKILQENKKSEKPYAETTLHGFRNTLTAIYNFAEKKYKIPNPCSRVQSMGVEDFIKPYDFWTPEEYLEFRKYVTEKYNDSEINLAYDMVYYGGLAKGELVALKADDIQENTVTIKGSGKDSTRARFGRSFKIPLFLSEAVHYFITTNHRKKLIFSASVVEKLGDILKEYQEDGPKRKKILLKEIQYSHVFLLIISGCTDTEIANRQGRNVRIIQKRFSKLFESEEAKRYLEEAKAGKIDYPYRLPARLMPQQDSLYIPKDTEQEPQNQRPEEKRPSLGNMVNVYGYRVENNALVVDKEEAIAVRRLFKIYRDGEGANCGIVARCLTDEYGYKKRNGSAFTSTDVSKIWQRKELYQGKYQEKYGQYKAILPDPLSSVADYLAFDPDDYQLAATAANNNPLSCTEENEFDTGRDFMDKNNDIEKEADIECNLSVEEAAGDKEDVISERSNGKEIVMSNETMKKIDVIASDGVVCTFNRPNKKWWEASGLIRIADMLNGNVAFRTRGSRKIMLVRMYYDTYANDEVSVNNQKVMSIKLFFTKQYAFANPCISTLFSISAEDVFTISDELDCDVVIQTKGENKEEYEIRPVFEENENKPNEVPNDIPRSDEKNKPVDIDSDELPF